MADIKTIGTVLSDKKYVLRSSLGVAKSEDDKRYYELNANVDGSPLIRSAQTGNFFSISWNEIIGAAIAGGIDEPLPDINVQNEV